MGLPTTTRASVPTAGTIHAMRTLAVLLSAFPLLCLSAPTVSGQTPDAKPSEKPARPHDPFGMRTWQLVLLRKGPNHGSVQGAARAKAFEGHFANMNKLALAGKLRLAGPTQAEKKSRNADVSGLFLLDVKTPAEAVQLCQTDPCVAAGIFTVETIAWYGPSDITFRGDALGKPPVHSLFNGQDLKGWHTDIPRADDRKDLPPSFVVEGGLLISRGSPQGHLITDQSFQDYQLVVEYRWPGKPGNCGILVHASKPRMLYKMFPQSVECQMFHGNAGDFWCIGEDIKVPDMEKRRGPKKKWGVVEGKARRILNLTDGSENPLKEWNQMVIECRGNRIDVWVNGDHVNSGTDCTAQRGQIAVQAEGAVCEFRKIQLTPLPALPAAPKK